MIQSKQRNIQILRRIQALTGLVLSIGFLIIFSHQSKLAIEVSRLNLDARVMSVAFSPDGGLNTGKEIARDSRRADNAAEFSSDGKYSMVYDHRTVIVREIKTAKELIRIRSTTTRKVALSSDNKRIAIADDNIIHLVESATCNEVIYVQDYKGDYYSDSVALVFSPKGKYVVRAEWGYGEWQLIMCKEIARMSHEDDITAVLFGPDDKYIVSASRDMTARIWDVNTGKEVTRMTHPYAVGHIAVSPSKNYIASANLDRIDADNIMIWNAITGELITRIASNHVVTSEGGFTIVFSPNGKYIMSKGCNKIRAMEEFYCAESLVRVWETPGGKEVARMQHKYVINSIAFSSDGKNIYTVGEDGTVRVWLYQQEDLVKARLWLLIPVLIICLWMNRHL